MIVQTIEVTELAATMVDLGLNWSKNWIWEHEEIQRKGAKLLSEN